LNGIDGTGIVGYAAFASRIVGRILLNHIADLQW
jgi:hypothetical protein